MIVIFIYLKFFSVKEELVLGRQILPQGGISCFMVSELFLSGSRIRWQLSEDTVCVGRGKDA